MPLLFLLIALLSSSAFADWEPVFVDNFNGKELSRSHWVKGQENLPKQLQRYDSRSIEVTKGLLRLHTSHNANGTRPYLSGAVTSQGLFAQKYGYFEVRAKLPGGNGFWPAFWLMPVSGHWTSEIDIFEYIGNSNGLHHAMHYDWRAQNQNGKTIKPGKLLSAQFNTYALHWTPTEIRYLLNGKVTHKITRKAVVDKASDPMYLMLNTALASQHTGWIKGTDASSKLQQTFDIDFVRVYRQVAKGPFKHIPSHTQPVGDIKPSPYDNVAISIDVIEDKQSTPAIFRQPTVIKAQLALRAHKAMDAVLWVSLHKARKFHSDGRIDADKLEVQTHKLNFSTSGQMRKLHVDFSKLGPMSPGFYYLDVVVRDNPRRHSNRSAARILSYQYPDREEAVYWDAFIREASAQVSGTSVTVHTDLQLQEAMLNKRIIMHYRIFDKRSGRTLYQEKRAVTHNAIGLMSVNHRLNTGKIEVKQLAIAISASDGSNKNRSAEHSLKLSQLSPPETVELKFDESR
jgi:beta-glucanase (GH16 family)